VLTPELASVETRVNCVGSNALSIFHWIVVYIPWIVNLGRSILRQMEQRFEKAKRLLAENVKRRRRELGMSQESLALAAEVDRTYVSQIERAMGNPSLLILCKICEVLAIEPIELLVTPSPKK